METDIQKFRDLFVHRDDVFAAQHKDGSYNPVKEPLTDYDIEAHLAGVQSYGVYVIRPLMTQRSRYSDGSEVQEPLANTVKYLVFDLDTYEEEAVDWLVDCLESLVDSVWDSTVQVPKGTLPRDYECLLMENSGGKGFHAWLFLSEPLPAVRVRSWVAQSFLPMWQEQADFFAGTPLEVFPKQDEVVPGAFGNLVKLPLGVHAKSGRRSEIVPVQGWANSVDTVQKLDVSLVPQATSPKECRSPERAGRVGEGGPQPAPFACVSRIIEEGAPQGCRDKAMYHFARFALTQGLPEDLVQEWAERVNEEFSPPLTNTEVRTKVRSACNASSEKHSCNADWLKDFCPGGEHCKAPWNEERAGKVSVNASAAGEYLDLTPEQRREARLRGRV